MTEAELLEGLTDWLYPKGTGPRTTSAHTLAAECLAYLRAHADRVCQLLGGVGPKPMAVVRAKLRASLAELPKENLD